MWYCVELESTGKIPQIVSNTVPTVPTVCYFLLVREMKCRIRIEVQTSDFMWAILGKNWEKIVGKIKK